MIYIETDKQGYIVYQHNLPFHEKRGLHKTTDELLQDGYLVESVPEAPLQEGKTSKTKYVNGAFEFVYEHVPKSETELDNERLTQLEADLGNVLFESAMDKAKIAELELAQGDLLMELAMLKMGGNL